MSNNPYENVPVKKIGLKQWYKDNPSPSYVEWQSSGRSSTTKKQLNQTQLDAVQGKINVYAPVEAYKQKWFHKKDTYYPLNGTRVREDLPPIYIQWKDDYRKRNASNTTSAKGSIPERS